MNKLLHLLTCLVLTACGGGVSSPQSSIFYSQGGDTIASIEAQCSTLCEYHVAGPLSLTQNGAHTLSSNVTLIDDSGSPISINGSSCALTIGSGRISAPAVQIFTGNCSIEGLVEDKPEWFTPVPSIVKNAVDALLSSGGKVKFQQTAYRSGYDISSGAFMTKANVELAGAGEGQIPSLVQVVGGTRILGPFYMAADNVYAHDFCVDSGSAVVAAYYSGIAQDAYAQLNPGQASRTQNQVQNIERVCGLVATKSAANHAILLENVNLLHCSSLLAVGGTHGLVMKTTNSSCDGIVSYTHSIEGVYLKSDSYAPASDTKISNVTTFDTEFGVYIQADTAVAERFTATGVTCQASTTVCIEVQNGAFTTRGVDVSTVSAQGNVAIEVAIGVQTAIFHGITSLFAPGSAFNLSGNNVVIDGFQIGGGTNAAITIGSTAGIVLLTNGIIESGSGTAIQNSGNSTAISNVVFAGAWGGYCIQGLAGATFVSHNLGSVCALGLTGGSGITTY